MYKIYKFAPSYCKKVEQFLLERHNDSTGITQTLRIDNDRNMIKNYARLKVQEKHNGRLVEMVEKMFEYYAYSELSDVDYITEEVSNIHDKSFFLAEEL